jgi:hypothetical protein
LLGGDAVAGDAGSSGRGCQFGVRRARHASDAEDRVR